ncbi:hypothetical protein ACU8KH_02286 [Lachancea thermotolerans]
MLKQLLCHTQRAKIVTKTVCLGSGFLSSSDAHIDRAISEHLGDPKISQTGF